jgi:putative (di)nucleoside polyphosphate hydrolase
MLGWKTSMDIENLPYRPCAGIALFNRDGLVFVGRRKDGPHEAEGVGKWWQMPQGGIDDGEDFIAAAERELYEETSVRSVTRLGETADWFTYDLPPELIGRAWRGKYRGQRIKYAAFRFDGDDSEIDIAAPGGGHKPEFLEWRWERLERTPGLIIPFKRQVYDSVAKEFARFAKAA